MAENTYSNWKERGIEAARHLVERRGYEVLSTSWECEAGKIDIVARDENCLVLIEVNTQTDMEKGLPAEGIAVTKRAHYEKIAIYYLSQHPMEDIYVRFDEISIMVVSPDHAFVRHLINAFSNNADD